MWYFRNNARRAPGYSISTCSIVESPLISMIALMRLL